jgi:uncharacterized membrane protein
MGKVYGGQYVTQKAGYRHVLHILLWLAISTGAIAAVLSLIQELCFVNACKDTASFTIFGANMGWFGIAYFSCILTLIWLRKKLFLMDWALSAMVFAGVGSEFRLLWIQKYIIGSWCPYCVTICGALFIAAIVLTIEKVQNIGRGELQESAKSVLVWTFLVAAMAAIGLAVAFIGVKSL